VDKQYLSTAELAEYLGRSVWWVNMHRAEIPHRRLLNGGPYEYDRAEIDAWLESRKHRPETVAS
jgi:predicted DNA-binding transcriptional regulator AlpA